MSVVDTSMLKLFESKSPFERLAVESEVAILQSALTCFSQRPLIFGCDSYLDMHEMMAYDAIFGYLIRRRERALRHPRVDRQFANWFDSFAYHGVVYRILDLDDESHINWHGCVCSWTSDPKSFINLNKTKIAWDEPAVIVKADISEERFGIDVNELRRVLHIENEYLRDECEVIFPMIEESFVDVQSGMSLREYFRKEGLTL